MSPPEVWNVLVAGLLMTIALASVVGFIYCVSRRAENRRVQRARRASERDDAFELPSGRVQYPGLCLPAGFQRRRRTTRWTGGR